MVPSHLGPQVGLGAPFPFRQCHSASVTHTFMSPHVPVGMAAGLRKELWVSATVSSLAHIFLVPYYHYKEGKKEMSGLEREL